MRAALIGAGEESLHTIKEARRLGVFVTALDGNPAAPGLAAADQGLAVDISKEGEVLEALRYVGGRLPEADREGVESRDEVEGRDGAGPDFVITGPIGRYLTTAGAVNDAFHLRGISRKSAVWCTDKYLFHQKLHDADLRDCHCELAPAFCGKSGEEKRALVDNLLKKAEKEISFPAVLKPRFGSGSRGIFFVNTLRELREALAELAGVTVSEGDPASAGNPASDEDYVLEEAAPGVEYGVDAALDGKNYCQILLRRKLLTPPPARQAVGYFSVTGEDEREARLISQVREHLEQVAAVLELADCLLHADLMISGGRIFVIELSARPSGHHLHDVFTPMATGVDMAQAYIRCQCGRPFTYEPKETHRLLIRYFDLPEGIVRRVPDREALALPEGVTLRAWDCQIRPGDRMERVTTGHSVMGRGYFILEGRDDKTLEAAANEVLREFGVE
ncbi:MAG TPA: ATP-grasp domain-containing protein [Candidatus Eisenbergiella merdavium]|uniref:ATP-grasp domain-containing protein n=1 Tax=Candidatus Eisenbergiella merdavium TaxID=2838551 RepID=A0A9D2NAX4_9FIRM|nr:ATP-grasp domain-containing protein [Candidatus Eisenbergiella merdavium]